MVSLWYFHTSEFNRGTLTTVQCCYNKVNCLPNSHNRHPIACPWGQDMGCLMWSQNLTHVLPQSQQPFHAVLDYRADSRFVPSQWEMAWLCKDVSHWLAASLETALGLRYNCTWLYLHHMKYAHGLCFAVFCCGLIQVNSLAPGRFKWNFR